MSLNESAFEEAALSWFGELGYPPDLQDEEVKIVLMQAELLSAMWATA